VGRREGDITSYANTDKANTVLGWKASLLWRSYGERLEMGTESEKRNNNNEKCAVFESYFNSLVQKL
jgi:UDP-glucose 4-epimerase